MTIEREKALAYAARGWEGDVCDLFDASDVAAALIEETLSQTGPGVDLSADEVRRILFVTYQTNRMMSALRDRYYEAIEAKG